MAGVLYNPNQPIGLIQTAIPMPSIDSNGTGKPMPTLPLNPTAVPFPKPTLGQRNNNFGNLRTTDSFLGKTGKNKSYDTYETPEMGLRALARVLDTYSTKHGINTIDQLVNRYAPASDNTGGSHENYKKFLSTALGVGVNDPLDVKNRRVDIMDAIIRFENKNRSLATRDQLQQAIYDADGVVPKVTIRGTTAMVNDGYDAMRQLGYTEEEIAAAKRKGVPAEFYDAKQGFLDGVLADPTRDASANDNIALRGKAGVLNDAPIRDITVRERTNNAPLVDALEEQRIAREQAANRDQFRRDNQLRLVNSASASSSDPTMQYGALSALPEEPQMTAPRISSNRRDLSPMALTSPTIDNSEMLMRVGLAGVGGSQQGGLQALSDMGSMYGAIQDANRATGLEAYKTAMDAAAKGNSEPDADTQAQLSQMDAALFDMQKAKEFLKEGGITGLFDNNIKGFFDKMSGNKRAVGRKLLERLRVDDTLLRIAQTKGAISNKEMDLFLSPSPDLNDQESVWEQWIDDRIQAITRVRSRLAGGQTVSSAERASAGQVNQFASQAPSTSQVSPNVAAARAAISE